MGLITSRLKGKRRAIDLLERLETDINSIKRTKEFNKQNRRRVASYIKAISIGLYTMFIVLYLYFYMGLGYDWLGSLLYASPLVILAWLLVSLRSCMFRHYDWWLIKNSIKLKEMREEKKKLLEDVMQCETYKVAKPILDKYGIPDENTNTVPYTDDLDDSSESNTSTEKYALKSVDVK